MTPMTEPLTRTLWAALCALGLTLAVAVSVALGDSAPLAAAAIAAAALVGIAAAVIASRTAVTAAPRHELAVGARSRAHRESLSHQAEPAHPLTAGRPLSRAPGAASPAA